MSKPQELVRALSELVPVPLRRPVLASAIGLCGTLFAGAIWLAGGRLVTNADWALYDLWAAHRPAPVHGPILLVEDRDSTHDGSGPRTWDRATQARVIAALTQADAAAIGLDEYVTTPSSPDHGGAAGDALLAEAIAQSERVVLPLPVLAHEAGITIRRAAGSPDKTVPHASWMAIPTTEGSRLLNATPLLPLLPSVADHAAAIAHQVGILDADGQPRRLPLVVRMHDHLVLSFGLALYLTAQHIGPGQIRIQPGDSMELDAGPGPDDVGHPNSIPLDDQGLVLLPGLGRPTSAVRTLPLGHLLQAVERKEFERVRGWADHTIVVLPSTSTSQERGGPDRLVQQMVLLHGLFTRNWVAGLATPWHLSVAWLVASLGTGLLLRWKDWRGPLGLSALVAIYGLVVWFGLSTMRTALPLWMPLAAVTFAGVGSVLWNHFSASRHLRALEEHMLRVQSELAAVREALVCQESTVEQLEEDLEEARAQGARATDREQALTLTAAEVQCELDQARACEADTRDRVAQLERELTGLRTVSLRREAMVERELEELRLESERMGILTRDPRLLKTFRDLKRGAHSILPVLILGESGTGKELFARAVHHLSPRQAHPFVAVNMAAISPELFESELFGHVRGSFTGATQDRPGYFELAERGTIFLDEIGDLRPEHQAKLLRVLQDRTCYRVGATHPTVMDVRIVAATNKDLLRGIAEGWFREDLYARLKGLVVELPALRDRPDDLGYLADHFLKQAAARAQRQEPSLTRDAMTALKRYHWPHNVRELAQCLEQAVTLADTPVLSPDDLRLPEEARASASVAERHPSLPDVSGDTAVLECLRRHAFDMQATARALGWDRSTVTQRLKGLCFQALVDSRGDKAKAAAVLARDTALIRTVELKLLEYMEHLSTVVSNYRTQAEAIAACRKRFKNLPDRHFKAVEVLIARQFGVTRQMHSKEPPSAPADRRSTTR